MKGLDKAEFRRKWELIEAEENALLRSQTIQQTVAEFDKLRREFRTDMEADEEYRTERYASLLELQRRLHTAAKHYPRDR